MADPFHARPCIGDGSLPPGIPPSHPLSDGHLPPSAHPGSTPTKTHQLSHQHLPVAIPSHPTLFVPPTVRLRAGPPERPLRVIVLTSIRDVGVAEGVGDIRSRGSLENEYLEGTIETIARSADYGALQGYVELAGVITDDQPAELHHYGYPTVPTYGRPWIHPLNLRNAAGELISSITRNIPSTFRSLPRDAVQERTLRKLQMEEQIVRFMEEQQADIVLSDHYMARLEFLLDESRFSLRGRVLNTHCGPIRDDHPHPFRGPEPYRSALDFAESRYSDALQRRYRGWHPVYTGATLHFVASEIDAGQPICEYEATVIFPGDLEAAVISRLYPTSKAPVVIAGLRHYAMNIFPHLQELPSLTFEPRQAPHPSLPIGLLP